MIKYVAMQWESPIVDPIRIVNYQIAESLNLYPWDAETGRSSPNTHTHTHFLQQQKKDI